MQIRRVERERERLSSDRELPSIFSLVRDSRERERERERRGEIFFLFAALGLANRLMSRRRRGVFFLSWEEGGGGGHSCGEFIF